MKRIIMALLLLTGCTNDTPTTTEQVQVQVLHVGGGCALSKVRIFDDEGNQYQAQGCTDGVISFPDGRRFGWAESIGTDLKGFSVFLVR